MHWLCFDGHWFECSSVPALHLLTLDDNIARILQATVCSSVDQLLVETASVCVCMYACVCVRACVRAIECGRQLLLCECSLPLYISTTAKLFTI